MNEGAQKLKTMPKVGKIGKYFSPFVNYVQVMERSFLLMLTKLYDNNKPMLCKVCSNLSNLSKNPYKNAISVQVSMSIIYYRYSIPYFC